MIIPSIPYTIIDEYILYILFTLQLRGVKHIRFAMVSPQIKLDSDFDLNLNTASDPTVSPNGRLSC